MRQKNTSYSAFSSGTCAFVILTMLVVGCGRFGKSPSGGVGNASKLDLPSPDSNERFPAISGDVLDALIAEAPELAKHREKLLEAERSIINRVLNDIRTKSPEGRNNAQDRHRGPSVSRVVRPKTLPEPEMPGEYDSKGGLSIASLSRKINLIPTAHAAAPDMPDMGGIENYLIGGRIAQSQPDAGTFRDTDRGTTKTDSMKDEQTGTVQVSLTTSIGADGTIGIELTTAFSMPLFGLSANSRVKLTGNQCPNSEGKVDLKVEVGSNGRAGSSGSVIYDKTLTAQLKANVNDEAEVAGVDVDVKQTTRSTAGGRQVYVETSQSGHGATSRYSGVEWGDVRIDRASSQATPADQALSDAGLGNASLLAQGVFENAMRRWQSGGCVKIVASSPGTVAVNSTNQIPVTVVHVSEGMEVPSKLTAELSGGASVDPTLIPKTAGTLTYVAPGETGKSATIKLTANSRRGRATLDLTASTGGDSYQIVGGLDDFQTDTSVCDVMKPFTLTGGGITNKFSGGLSGTYNFTGPFQSKGSGTYTISLPSGPGKPGTMTGQGSGSVMGRYTRSGTEQYTLTPIAPCSD